MKRWLLVAFFAAGAVFAQEAAEHKTGESAGNPDEIWKWANFGILAVGLGYLMAKQLPPLFSSRSKEIQKGISESQQMKQDAERRAAEMDARLAALGADIEKFRVQSGAEMRQEGERISRDTAAQIKKIEEQAAVEIEAAGKTARRNTLFGTIGVPSLVPNTNDSGSEFLALAFHFSTSGCSYWRGKPSSCERSPSPITMAPMPGTLVRIASRFSMPLMSSICSMTRISPLGLSGQTSARS